MTIEGQLRVVSVGASDDSPHFERVNWNEIDRSRSLVSVERLTLLVGVLALVALYLYDTYVTHVYVVADWQLNRVDLVFLLGLVLLVSFVAVPVVRHRHGARHVLDHFRRRPTRAAAACFLAVFFLVGLFGPLLLGSPRLRFEHSFHAPYGFTSRTAWTTECLGAVTQGDGITRYCHGSLTYPLGTNARGHSMLHLTVTGARVALYVAVFAAAFVVPLAAAVGLTAGLRGGLVDDLLMAYVDVQLCLPAIVVYFVGYMYWNKSLLLLLVTFGLLSWGGIARLVRSEVLQRREDGHVLVARSLGAPRRYIARRHLLPNITNTLVPAVFQLLALLVLVEAGVAFLGFHEVDFYSWGSTIEEGLHTTYGSTQMAPHEIWWISTIPAIALTATLFSFKLVGDGLRDALDPRGEH